jgi:hypothetical protein
MMGVRKRMPAVIIPAAADYPEENGGNDDYPYMQRITKPLVYFSWNPYYQPRMSVILPDNLNRRRAG